MGLRGVPEDAAVHGEDGKVIHLRTRDPHEALSQLFAAGVRHVMVEGGSRILNAFLSERLVDELIVYLAPTLLGSGTSALTGLGISTLADAQRWDWDASSGGAVQALGRDLRLHLLPERPSEPHQTQNPMPAAAQEPSTDPLPARTAAGTATGGY
jgi:diaminohydroxyphosphoribosylaminopyrimidine deaminase/5-amino-6-(5-phosphoribosylamino)uracil reductase